jgi:hypothetical protein
MPWEGTASLLSRLTHPHTLPSPCCLHATFPLPASHAVATDTSPNFCESCVCALLDLYTPAFEAAGLLDGPVDTFMNSAMGIITSCSAVFLGPLMASGTDIAGLQRLASQCNFSATNVPRCLVATIAALNATNVTASNATAPDPNVTASAGGCKERGPEESIPAR